MATAVANTIQELAFYLSAHAAQQNVLTRLLGSGDTPREILQQPWTWRQTAAQLADDRFILEPGLWLEDPKAILLCGVGSGHAAARSVEFALRLNWEIPVEARPATDFIVHPRALFPYVDHTMMAHLSGNGNDPESVETLRIGLDVFHDSAYHWVVTCNTDGKLAELAREHPDACALTVLHPVTNDNGRCATSSYTNLSIAGLWFSHPEDFGDVANRLALAAERLFNEYAGILNDIARQPSDHVVYLGTGALEAAAFESARLLETMTRGKSVARSSSFLGVSYRSLDSITEDTLVVGYLSTHTHARIYEEEVIERLPNCRRVLVVEEADPLVQSFADVVIELPELADIPDAYKAPAASVVGQLFALFRAVSQGIDPDGDRPVRRSVRVRSYQE
ncbi:MAG: hypothetical protein O3A46_01820 [Candidatus Poribacteria bacterium]|nr:hypothetical protein [Candidatus Poribacteria bacterium]